MARGMRDTAGSDPQPERTITVECENPTCRAPFEVSTAKKRRRYCTQSCASGSRAETVMQAAVRRVRERQARGEPPVSVNFEALRAEHERYLRALPRIKSRLDRERAR